MAFKVDSYRYNAHISAQLQPSQLQATTHVGIMSAADVRNLHHLVDAAKDELRAKKEFDRRIESSKEELKVLRKQAIPACIAVILGIEIKQVTSYVSERDLERFDVDFKAGCLKFDTTIFKEVILKTFKEHPELKICNLQVCDLQGMTYLTDLFKEIVSTKIEVLVVPRRLNTGERMEMMSANGKLVMSSRPLLNLQVVSP